MSPVLVTRLLLKRWFTRPAFAVIAAAASLGIVGVHAIDAWKASKHPRVASPEPSTTTVIGRASIDHIKPDRISWSISVDVSGKRKPDVERALVAARQRAVQQLLDAGINAREIRILEPGIDEQTTETNRSFDDNSSTAIVTGYEGSQSIDVHSARLDTILDAYAAISVAAPPELSVPAPECWLSDTASMRRHVQEAALDDVHRQATELGRQLGAPALGRLTSFTTNDVDLAGRPDIWACNEGMSIQATAVATYWLK